MPDLKTTRSPRPSSGTDLQSRWSQGSISRRERSPRPSGLIFGPGVDGATAWEIPRRVETSGSVVPFSSEASSSDLQQVSTAASSDNPTGERLCMSMTEEGPSGDYRVTIQLDRHGRRLQIKKNDEHPEGKWWEKLLRRKMPGARNLFDCVVRGKHIAWIIWPQSTERRRGIPETPFCRRTNVVFEGNRDRMARSTQFQGGDHHRLHASGCDQRKHRERVISSRLVLRWKETDTGYKAKARDRWCVHDFKDSCPTPELSSINIYTADLGIDYVRRDVGQHGEGIHARWSECSRWTTIPHSTS